MKTAVSLIDTAAHGGELQPHWLIAVWLGFVDLVPPAEDKVPSPDQKSFHTYMYNSNITGTKTMVPRVDNAPHGVKIRFPPADC